MAEEGSWLKAKKSAIQCCHPSQIGMAVVKNPPWLILDNTDWDHWVCMASGVRNPPTTYSRSFALRMWGRGGVAVRSPIIKKFIISKVGERIDFVISLTYFLIIIID